jgi:superfamily II DNA or RNA helicase
MPVISRDAIREYLATPKKDSTKAKLFTRGALRRKLEGMLPRPRFHTPPKKHQMVGFLLNAKYRYYIDYYDLGLGKSWLALNTASYFIACSKVEKVMVMVPNTANINDFMEQVETHTPNLTAIPLGNGEEERLEAFDSDADIIIGTYAGWWTAFSKKVINKKKTKKAGKTVYKLKLDPTKIRRYGRRFQMMVLDELNMVSNTSSLPHRLCWQLGKEMYCRLGLSATPFAKEGDGPLDVFGQFRVIDRGETFGTELGLFRGAFFNDKKNFWGGHIFTFNKAQRQRFHEFLHHRSIRYRQSECFDLPPLVEAKRVMSWPLETWAYYERLLTDLRKAKGNFRLTKNTFLQMRQVASGFLTVRDPEDEKHVIRFKNNPKKEVMLQILEAIPPGKKAIIFHDFQTSGEIISSILKEAKIKHVRIVGGQARRNGEARDRFVKDKGIQVLVSSTAGAYGLNLQVANYVIFYELPNNPLTWKQMTGRAYRQGQEERVFMYYLLVKNSVEMKIHKSIKEGLDLFKLLVDGEIKVADVF